MKRLEIQQMETVEGGNCLTATMAAGAAWSEHSKDYSNFWLGIAWQAAAYEALVACW